MKTSASGGYLKPTNTRELPNGLTLDQFIQTVLVGVSTLPGEFIRPKWQENPPPNPDLTVNWMAYGIQTIPTNRSTFIGMDKDGNTTSVRQESIEVECSFYGPNALDYVGLVQDGFQIPQNLDVLRLGNMGFKETSNPLHIPDLVNERFINRWEMSVVLRREVQRFYPILPLVSAKGKIHTVLDNEEYKLAWKTKT